MNHNNEQTLCDRLVAHFGTDNLLALLPQRGVRQALNLVTVRELAESLSVNYDTFRSHMYAGRIAFPTFRVQRRNFYTAEEADEIRRKWRAERELPR